MAHKAAVFLIACAALLAFCWLMSGPRALTNDEIIRETNKCTAAGMRASEIMNGWTEEIVRVNCEPK